MCYYCYCSCSYCYCFHYCFVHHWRLGLRFGGEKNHFASVSRKFVEPDLPMIFFWNSFHFPAYFIVSRPKFLMTWHRFYTVTHPRGLSWYMVFSSIEVGRKQLSKFWRDGSIGRSPTSNFGGPSSSPPKSPPMVGLLFRLWV